MKRFAFLTRHTATGEQIKIASDLNIELIPIGDKDAFTVTPEDILSHGSFDGVIVVHPSAAIRLNNYFDIGVFENEKRTVSEYDRPQFFAKSLHIYSKDY